MRGTDISWESSILAKVHGVLDEFVSNKEESSIKIADPIPIKARDPSLTIMQKIDPMMNIKIVK